MPREPIKLRAHWEPQVTREQIQRAFERLLTGSLKREAAKQQTQSTAESPRKAA
jgi:hypothetical protein